MSERRSVKREEKGPAGAPKYIVAYSGMVTILLAFFICLNVVGVASTQECGYIGPGIGAFKEGFMSHGLPGLLKGMTRPVGFNAETGKYQTDEIPTGEGEESDNRQYSAPDGKDVAQAQQQTLSTERQVVLPLALQYSETFSARDREQLAALARTLRPTQGQVLIRATLPAAAGVEGPWADALSWALRTAEHLCNEEGLPRRRLVVAGRLCEPSEKASSARADSVLDVVLVPLDGARNLPFGKGSDVRQDRLSHSSED